MMKWHGIVVFLIFICMATSATAALVEPSCATLQDWDVVDLAGDGEVEVVSVHNCPASYGGKALEFRGNKMVALAKGEFRDSATIVALYRENDARNRDADGVLLFWADYAEDLAVVHNTKEEPSSIWLEQDNDCGIQFRFIGPDKEERILVEHPGEGLVTDAWNKTGWIWQKVQFEGTKVRARFWPLEQAEPDVWQITADYASTAHPHVQGKRLGIKINSGDILLAHFAVDDQDIPISTPACYLCPDIAQLAQDNPLPLRFFINADTTAQNAFWVRASDATGVIAEGTLSIPVKAGHTEFSFSLSNETDSETPTIAWGKTPAAGLLKVSITDEQKRLQAETEIPVIATGALQKKLAAMDEAIAVLRTELEKVSEKDERYAALQVLYKAANVHCQTAHQHFIAGRVEEVLATTRFATEALQELQGYKGLWFKAVTGEAPPLISDVDQAEKQAEDTQGTIRELYHPAYRIYFSPVESIAKSFVAGQQYKLRIPWQVEGATPDRDYKFQVRLLSPLGTRTVATADTAPETPTSMWEPGKTYFQDVVLQLSPEQIGDAQPTPTVVDEYHRLLVSLRDPNTNAPLMLGNAPGDFQDLVGTSFPLGTFYVSLFPVDIRDFNPVESTVLAARSDRVVVHNTGEAAQKFDVLFSVRTATDRVIYQGAKPVSLAGNAEEKLSFDWTPNTAGDLTFDVTLLQEGCMRTQSEAAVHIAFPEDVSIQVSKSNHTQTDGGRFYTPIQVAANGVEMTAQVFASNGKSTGMRQVGGNENAASTFTVNAEPWFGYYDILLDGGAFRYDARCIATVVETVEGDLRVNGEPFLVKGVNVHGLDAASPARTAAMMKTMRDLGFNTWRGDYPAPWQMDLAYELNSAYTVLGPYSCCKTDEVFAREDGPALATAREKSRLLVERYRDSAGVLLWNSCNEIKGETADFLETLYPVFKQYDPMQRPVHYANLYGQDYVQGQDLVGINYYFGAGQRPEDKYPMIERSVTLAHEKNLPVIYTEYNSFYGCVHSGGVLALDGMFNWGIEKLGIQGGFYYMKIDSSRHPGVFDQGYNTYKILNDALRKAYADAEIKLLSVADAQVELEISNRRRYTLRQLGLAVSVAGMPLSEISLPDLEPKGIAKVTIPLPENTTGPTPLLEGKLRLVTHYGFSYEIPFQHILNSENH